MDLPKQHNSVAESEYAEDTIVLEIPDSDAVTPLPSSPAKSDMPGPEEALGYSAQSSPPAATEEESTRNSQHTSSDTDVSKSFAIINGSDANNRLSSSEEDDRQLRTRIDDNSENITKSIGFPQSDKESSLEASNPAEGTEAAVENPLPTTSLQVTSNPVLELSGLKTEEKNINRPLPPQVGQDIGPPGKGKSKEITSLSAPGHPASPTQNEDKKAVMAELKAMKIVSPMDCNAIRYMFTSL